MYVLSWCGKRECAHREAAKADGKIFITLCMLSFFIEVSANSPSNAFGKTITVGGDYRTVGDALRDAEDGDTVEVAGGEYHEQRKIDKAIHLKGIERPEIHLERGHIMEVTSPDVTIEGDYPPLRR